MSRFRLSRRGFLRGLAGGSLATIALPALEAMFNSNGTAHSDGTPLARRFVCFFFGNGILLDKWTPTAVGPDYELTEQLMPIANVKDYCHVLTGFDNKHGQKITHHEGMAGMWSGHPFIRQGGGLNSKFGGPSIDQVVAEKVGMRTTYPSLEIGVSKRVSTDEGPTMQFMSHKSTNEPMPPEYSPRALFQRIFSAPPPDDPSRPSRIDVLDAVLEDAHALRNQIGAADKLRLDAHLESVSRLQGQINALPPVCMIPAEPTQENIDVGGIEPLTEVSHLMSDLLVYAFTCDLTRVASYMLSPGVGHAVYDFTGSLEEQHLMSHDPVGAAVPLNLSIIWNVEQYAYLLERMKATEDGVGNLLDSSVVLLGSDCSEGWSHRISNTPVVVGGLGGGMIKRGGGHLRQNGRNVSDVLLTCARTVAPEITEVGSAEMRSTTPVSEILV